MIIEINCIILVVSKGPQHGKIDEDQLQIFDDLPSSAVELQVKDKVSLISSLYYHVNM